MIERRGDAMRRTASDGPEAIRVCECMTHRPTTLRADAPVWAAAELMKARKIRHLPVLDERGRLEGVVSDRDLRRVVLDTAVRDRPGARADTLRRLPLRAVMTWAVVTASPSMDLGEAARVMHEERIGCLPVQDVC